MGATVHTSPASAPEALNIPPFNLFLPPGSLVLVTGVNGLIASHAADQFLSAGYRVLGTVRSLSKTSYLVPLFTSRHGPNHFSRHEMPDLSAPGVWDSVFSSNPGITAVAHVVGCVDLEVSDPDPTAEEDLRWHVSLLEAAARAGSTVKSFVFTSSAWAAWTPDSKKKVTLTQDSWNDEAISLARDKGIPASEKGMAGFMALKTLVEKGVWDWVRRENPPFTFNTLLVDTVIGECLAPREQGIPSTAGMVRWVWENQHVHVLDMMQPQWHADCRDTARLYVALLATKPVVDRERVYAFSDRYSFFHVAEILKRLYPERADKMARPTNFGVDQTTVPRQRGAELLARLGQKDGWRSLEESVRENAESWLQLEKGELMDHKYSKIGN
ncbi:hypothetical protein QBC42DRAFT_20457 [Cladorrhinum samala]|uniref:NAD-dependent epimerase/dehydratase domain-containing protein n=1 Tax=Cladorrhinum samala TaxID=585594 RepID=A0AAV9HDQ2_9PEZI|nr:hypothetical protein QBC42DRAFT_20457 [Cladorrhinum samala]